MEVFFKKPKRMRARAHAHTPISKQDQLISRRFVDLQQKCPHPHFTIAWSPTIVFWLEASFFFWQILDEINLNWGVFLFFVFFFACHFLIFLWWKDKEETWFVCHWCKLIPNYCWKIYNIHMNAYFHYDMLSNLDVIQNSKSHDY
jgi:hypothetical protein